VHLDEVAGDGQAEPEPPPRRTAVTSPWSNASKMRDRESGRMPRPVSVTTMRMRPAEGFSDRNVTRPPEGVNFAAFFRMFQKICWSRAPSPTL
jgi:hypothetical protein